MGDLVDAYRGNAGLWYQDDMGWPDRLSNDVGDDGDGDELDELEGDNLYDVVNLSCLIPDANATALNPIDIRNSTHLRT